jgi:hypothetical protein
LAARSIKNSARSTSVVRLMLAARKICTIARVLNVNI